MCGIEVEHDGKSIIAIRGDKKDVLSKGNICPKATGLQDIHTDPDRLRKPLVRVRMDQTTRGGKLTGVKLSISPRLALHVFSGSMVMVQQGPIAVAAQHITLVPCSG